MPPNRISLVAPWRTLLKFCYGWLLFTNSFNFQGDNHGDHESLARNRIMAFSETADVIKLTDEEAEWLCGVPAKKALEDPSALRQFFPRTEVRHGGIMYVCVCGYVFTGCTFSLFPEKPPKMNHSRYLE